MAKLMLQEVMIREKLGGKRKGGGLLHLSVKSGEKKEKYCYRLLLKSIYPMKDSYPLLILSMTYSGLMSKATNLDSAFFKTSSSREVKSGILLEKMHPL